MADEHNDAETPPPVIAPPDPDGVKWFRENSIPIAGIILIALVLCLVDHYSSITIDSARTKDFSEVFKNFVEVVAVTAGGVWAYFKFVRGRTFQESLIPLVTGRFVFIDRLIYLIVIIQIKNVGQSKIEFNHDGSALILFEYNSSDEKVIHTVADNRLTTFGILSNDDRYIEPNEIIQKERIISIPGPLKLGYRLEAVIVSTSGFTWCSTTIVDKASLSDNIDQWLIGL